MCAHARRLDKPIETPPESDSSAMRSLARQMLEWKQKYEQVRHLLGEWYDRWDDEDGFEGEEPGMADLLDQTGIALYGRPIEQTSPTPGRVEPARPVYP